MKNFTIILSVQGDSEKAVYERIKELVNDYRTNWFTIFEGDKNEPNTRGGMTVESHDMGVAIGLVKGGITIGR